MRRLKINIFFKNGTFSLFLPDASAINISEQNAYERGRMRRIFCLDEKNGRFPHNFGREFQLMESTAPNQRAALYIAVSGKFKYRLTWKKSA